MKTGKESLILTGDVKDEGQAHFFTWNGENNIATCKCGAEQPGVHNAKQLKAWGIKHLAEVRAAIADAKIEADAEKFSDDAEAAAEKREDEKATLAPFKFFVCAKGDWIICDPNTTTIKDAWKKFHRYALPKTHKVLVVHPSFSLTNGGLNTTAKSGAWAAVEVK